jgi:hypothetical protein
MGNWEEKSTLSSLLPFRMLNKLMLALIKDYALEKTQSHRICNKNILNPYSYIKQDINQNPIPIPN